MTDELVGQHFAFYGVDGNQFKLNDTIYEAIEDPDDGYRSYLRSIEVVESDGIFFGSPLAIVEVTQRDDGYHEPGISLVDESGHTWLEIGTDDTDDYYPCFVFQYYPKKE